MNFAFVRMTLRLQCQAVPFRVEWNRDDMRVATINAHSERYYAGCAVKYERTYNARQFAATAMAEKKMNMLSGV